jgi:hypothetical protein
MICNRPMDVCMRNLWQKVERGKKTGTNSSTRFPQASCFEKARHVCQKCGGARTLLKYQRYEKMRQEIGFLCSQERPKETSK